MQSCAQTFVDTEWYLRYSHILAALHSALNLKLRIYQVQAFWCQ